MNKFRISKFLSLKLEDEMTNIYINDKKFIQCKYLLLRRRFDEIEDLSEIKSVDEMSDFLNRSLEVGDYRIPPKMEFWGHCSNLQVWYESNYDTRLIHSNLAFPLLKELSNVGDQIALKVFKEEIARRLESGYEPVIEYLSQASYLDYLNREDVLYFLLESNDAEMISNIENNLNIKFKVTYNYNDLPTPNEIIIENRRITGINIASNKIACQIEDIFEFLFELEQLSCLMINNCNF